MSDTGNNDTRDTGKNGGQAMNRHLGFYCAAGEKIPLLMQILVQNNPKRSVVFCNSGANVEFVKKHFQGAGVADNSSRVVVHSDVTFRGERQRFDCVINFDVPYAPRMYEERLRAAGDGGSCISLLCDYYSDFAQPILDSYQVTCSWSPYAMQLPSRKKMQEWSAQFSSSSPPSPRRPQQRQSGKHTHSKETASRKTRPRYSQSKRASPADKSSQSKKSSLWSRIAALFVSKP